MNNADSASAWWRMNNMGMTTSGLNMWALGAEYGTDSWKNPCAFGTYCWGKNKGRKDGCDSKHERRHVRIYGPGAADVTDPTGGATSWYDPPLGYYVVGTTHIDAGGDECTGY